MKGEFAMNLFLTSSPYLYQHDPATLNTANGFVDQLREALPHRPKTLFICSDPSNHDMTKEFIQITKDAFGRAGVPLGRCTALDMTYFGSVAYFISIFLWFINHFVV